MVVYSIGFFFRSIKAANNFYKTNYILSKQEEYKLLSKYDDNTEKSYFKVLVDDNLTLDSHYYTKTELRKEKIKNI